MRKIFQNFKDLPIRRKILVTYLGITLLPILLLGYFSNQISTNMIIEKSLNNSAENLLLVNRNLDNLTENLKYYSTNLTLLISRDLENANLSNNSVLNELNIQSRMNITFNYTIYSYPNISSGVFVSSTGSIYGKDYRPKEIDASILDNKMIKDISKSEGGLVWFDIQKRDYLNQENVDRNKYILSVGKKIFNLNNGSLLGSLILNVTEDTISSIYKGLKLGKTGKYYIVNDDGIIVSSQSTGDILTRLDKRIFKLIAGEAQGGKVTTIGGKKILIAYSACHNLSWKLIGIVPLKELTAESAEITMAIVTTAIICLLLSIIASVLLANTISKPIVQLTKYTKDITKGGLTSQFKVISKDEVGQLGEGFNYMISNINQLIHDIYLEQKKEKELELKVLQLQINPHFLYNTLDSLHWQLVLNNQQKSAEIVLSLSNLLRYSISEDKGLSSIAKELKQLENYLSIQDLRFGDKIEFQISVADEIMDFCIPKLTFQPIVENSINHGLKYQNNYGVIRISGTLEGDYVVFAVEDNGIGIAETELKRIRERTYSGIGTGLGINNVNDRIELLLGLKNAVTIQSVQGVGTKVEIRLPQVKWEDRNEQA